MGVEGKDIFQIFRRDVIIYKINTYEKGVLWLTRRQL